MRKGPIDLDGPSSGPSATLAKAGPLPRAVFAHGAVVVGGRRGRLCGALCLAILGRISGHRL
jgi:hypothetical protein